MLRNLYLLGLLFLIGACAPFVAPQGPPVIAVTAAGVSQDRIIGRSASVVRAYSEDANGKRVEVMNAICTLRAPEFRARVTTPQVVQYPSFLQGERFARRGQPGPLLVSCKADSLSGATRVTAIPANLSSGATQTTSTVNGQTVTTTSAPLYSRQLSSSYPWYFGGTIAVTLR